MRYVILALLLTACGKAATPPSLKHFDKIQILEPGMIRSSAYWEPVGSKNNWPVLVEGISFAKNKEIEWFCEGKGIKAKGTLPYTPDNFAIARRKAHAACAVAVAK